MDLFRLFTALVGATMLSGCIPVATSYFQLDAPDAIHLRGPCYDGAPVGLRYQREEIAFEVSLKPFGISRSDDPYLKIRAPRDVTISIPDPTATLTLAGGDSHRVVLLTLRATALDWQGPYVEEQRRASEQAEHRFVLRGLPADARRGTLQLPVIHANGVPVESPELTFQRRNYAAILPLNC